MAEGVCEPGGEQRAEARALLVGEAGVEVVRVRVFEVDLLVGNVHVAADNHAFALGQAADIGPEGIFPLHAVIQPFEAVLGIGRIDIHQIEIRHLECQHSPFVVVFLNPDAAGYRKRRMAGIDGRPGIAFFLGIIPIGLIAQEFQVDLTRLQFGLLQAEEIGVELREHIGEAFAGYGPQAVDVPTDEFHTAKIRIKTENA